MLVSETVERGGHTGLTDAEPPSDGGSRWRLTRVAQRLDDARPHLPLERVHATCSRIPSTVVVLTPTG